MAKKKRKEKCLLDTNALRYLCMYEDSVRSYVENTVKKYDCEITPFVLMEYYRGVIIHLIDIYFVIKQSRTLEAAYDYLSAEFAVGKIRLIVQGISRWSGNFEPSEDPRVATLWRLGHYIFELAQYPKFHHCRDRIDCQLGKLVFPPGVFDETAMLAFRNEFRRVEKAPSCGQCAFRANQISRLTHAGIDLYSQAQRDAHNVAAYSKQAERLEKAASTKRNSPSCWWCMRLGDSIIALLSPRNSVLVSSDHAFVPLCKILGKQLVHLPSPRDMVAAMTGGITDSEN
jgi:hypothetical protein